MRPLAIWAALSVLVGVAAARGPSPGERVARAVESSLPRGLVVGQVLVPELPAGDVSVSWSATPRAGWANVLALVRLRGHEVARSWARVELLPLRRVLVAARPIVVGSLIDASDLVVQEIAVAAGLGLAIEPEALAGARALRNVEQGAIVGEIDVARPPAVPRGAQVKVVVHRGAVTVATSGTLERAARPGERSAARIASLGRLVQGRLADANTLVEEGESP